MSPVLFLGRLGKEGLAKQAVELAHQGEVLGVVRDLVCGLDLFAQGRGLRSVDDGLFDLLHVAPRGSAPDAATARGSSSIHFAQGRDRSPFYTDAATDGAGRESQPEAFVVHPASPAGSQQARSTSIPFARIPHAANRGAKLSPLYGLAPQPITQVGSTDRGVEFRRLGQMLSLSHQAAGLRPQRRCPGRAVHARDQLVTHHQFPSVVRRKMLRRAAARPLAKIGTVQ